MVGLSRRGGSVRHGWFRTAARRQAVLWLLMCLVSSGTPAGGCLLPTSGGESPDARRQFSNLLKQGRKLLRNGDFEAAEQAYRQALTLDGNAAEARCGLALVLIKGRRHAEAYQELQPLLERSAKHDNALALSGVALIRAGLFREGFDALKAALASKRNNPVALAGIAELACYENQLSLAAQFIEAAIAESPEEPDYYLLAARIASRLENFHLAAESLRNFLRLAPKTDTERRERIEGVIRFYSYLGTSRINVVQERADVTLPFELRGRRPHLKVHINGRGPFNFVLDTGASTCVLSNETAEKIGVRPVASGGQARAVGGNGTFPIVYGVLKSLELGPVKLATVPVYLRNVQSLTENGAKVDGFLGLSTLADFHLTLDYPQRMLGLRYAPRDVALKEGTAAMADPNTTEMPFRLTESGLISLETQLDDGYLLNFILDSGASASVIDQSVVERHTWQSKIAPDQSVRIVGAAGASEKVPLLRIHTLRVYDLLQHNLQLPVIDMRRLNESSGFEQSGILGGDFLVNCRIEIDFRRQRITFVPAPNGLVKRQTEPPVTARSGVATP